MQIVTHNLMSQNIGRQLSIIRKEKGKSAEKLSSGYRINRAGDDAAGLTISEKMRWQVRGLNRASQNIQDGISFIQTGEGALNEVESMLQRIRELAIQASNDTNSAEDRSALNQEVQQIKDGIQDIFDQTSYNDQYIFRVAYLPEVTGHPDNMNVFMTSASQYGGAEIDHMRFTFAEMGFSLSPDKQYITADHTYTTTLANGETLEIVGKKGSKASELKRVYSWSADSNGINVNGVSAVSWGTLLAQTGGVVQRDTDYSFTHHGMTISFNSGDADSLGRMQYHINGDGGINYLTWNAELSTLKPEQAVVARGSNPYTLSELNKAYFHDATLRLRADAQYVWTEDNVEGAHNRVTWTTLFNKDGSDDGWGVANNSDNETYNESTTYGHSVTNGTPSGMGVSITIQDQASRQAVINGMDNTVFGKSFYVPSTGKSDDNAVILGAVGGYQFTGNQGFAWQYNIGRDFDKVDDTISTGTVTRTLQSAGTMSGYVYNGTNWEACTLQGHTYEISVNVTDKDNATSHNLSGTTGVFYTGLPSTVSSSSFQFSTNANGSGARTYNSDKATLSTNLSGGGMTMAASIKLRDAGNTNKTTNASIVTSGKASVTMSVQEKGQAYGNISYEPTYKTKVNPPEKKLYVQAGSLKDQGIEVRWPALTNSIVGISSTETTTWETSQGAIRDMDDAIEMISEVRAKFGAQQNRLEYAYAIDRNTQENTQAAESRLRDLDYADEMVTFSKSNIVQRATEAMLAQANQQPQGILSLLQ